MALIILSTIPYFTLFTLTIAASCDETLTGSGTNYVGCQDTTVNCLTCQTWTVQSPHTHSFSSVGDHNYCRNPDNGYTIWCYTTDPEIRFAFCTPRSTGSPTTCEPKRSTCNEALVGDGIGYRGCQNRTEKGLPCQKWTSNTPHSHDRTSSNYPGTGLGNHNYCRNPDGGNTIWCYTTDPGTRYDYCRRMMTLDPTTSPTSLPTHSSTTKPSASPTSEPSSRPSTKPTVPPTSEPSSHPSTKPTAPPSSDPTTKPTSKPSISPSAYPTLAPASSNNPIPTLYPSQSPDETADPSVSVSPIPPTESILSTTSPTATLVPAYTDTLSTTRSQDDVEKMTTQESDEDDLKERNVLQNKTYLVIAPAVIVAICGAIICICCRIQHNKSISKQLSTVATEEKTLATEEKMESRVTHSNAPPEMVDDSDIINGVLLFDVNGAQFVTAGGLDTEEEDEEYGTGQHWNTGHDEGDDEDDDVIKDMVTPGPDLIDDDECRPPPPPPPNVFVCGDLIIRGDASAGQ
eukprot:808640_1